MSYVVEMSFLSKAVTSRGKKVNYVRGSSLAQALIYGS
jgi:hypothetical protein